MVHTTQIGDNCVLQEVECVEVVANVARAEDQSAVLAFALAHLLRNVGVLNDAWFAAFARHDADLLAGRCLPKHLVPNVGILFHAVAHKRGIGRLDECVIHAKGMDVLYPPRLHVLYDPVLDQGGVYPAVAVRRHCQFGGRLEYHLPLGRDGRQSTLREKCNVYAEVVILSEVLRSSLVIQRARHDVKWNLPAAHLAQLLDPLGHQLKERLV